MGSIVGYSRALLDGLDGDLNDEQRDDVRQVHQSANGLLGIVNRTLDFAKLEAGGVTVQPGPVQLWPVVEEAIAALQPLAAARGLDLDRTVPPNLPPVEADEESLRQVLVNLIANAIKFTDAGRVAVRAEQTEGRVTIAVSDTGVGIAREAQELIFQPFRQAESRNGAGQRRDRARPGDLPAARAVDGRQDLGRERARRRLDLLRRAARGRDSGGRARRGTVEPRPVTWSSSGIPRAAGRWSPRCAAGASKPWPSPARPPLHDLSSAAPRLVLFDVFLQQAGAWRHLAALRAAHGNPNGRVGLVGIADGGGRLVVPSKLDLLADADLEMSLTRARTGALP